KTVLSSTSKITTKKVKVLDDQLLKTALKKPSTVKRKETNTVKENIEDIVSPSKKVKQDDSPPSPVKQDDVQEDVQDVQEDVQEDAQEDVQDTSSKRKRSNEQDETSIEEK